MEQMHLIEFDMYCPACKHYNKDQNEEPCCECLKVPARENSRKPERWEEAD